MSPRNSRLVRRSIIGAAVATIILLGGLSIFSDAIVGPTPAPLQLGPLGNAPQGSTAAPIDGTWRVSGGSARGLSSA